jgi:hypothetical protein
MTTLNIRDQEANFIDRIVITVNILQDIIDTNNWRLFYEVVPHFRQAQVLYYSWLNRNVAKTGDYPTDMDNCRSIAHEKCQQRVDVDRLCDQSYMSF